MQNAYDMKQDVAIKGQLADNGPHDIVTYNNPVDQITFARAVEKVSADDDGVKLPDNGSAVIKGVALRGMMEENEYFPAKSAVPVVKKGRVYVEVEEAVTPDDPVYVVYDGRKQVQTLTFDADLVASNTINLKVNGEAISEVTFTTDHDTTMGLICSAIEALTGDGEVTSATCPGSGSRVITITGLANGVDFSVTDIVVAAGASQAVGTMAETAASIADAARGKFRKSADSPARALALTSASFMSAAAAGGLAIVDLNIT